MGDGHDDGWDSRLSLRIAEAQQAYDDWANERDKIEARLREAGELLQALKTVQRLEVHDRQDHAGTTGANPTNRGRLARMALENDGLVRTDEASLHFADIGLYESKQAASKNVFSTLRRAKDFRHEGPGLYRYVGLDPREESA